MNQKPATRSVRRIVLPSGRSIAVVRFSLEAKPTDGLHLCPECRSHLVQPVQWGETSGGSWELTLQCPNCAWLTDGVFNQDQVDQFEDQLDEGLADMLGDLRRLTQANMAQEIERFVAALETGLILPEDF